MQYPETFNMSRQEMAKWKCSLSRILFGDKGFAGHKLGASYFLEILNASIDACYMLLQDSLLYTNGGNDSRLSTCRDFSHSKYYVQISCPAHLRNKLPTVLQISCVFNN